MTNVAAGSYLIFAKTQIVGSTGVVDTDTCTLEADGSNVDVGEVTHKQDHEGGINLQAAHVFALPGTILLKCRSTANRTARMTKIAVIRVEPLQSDAVTG